MIFLQRLAGVVLALGLLAAALVFASILLAIAVGAAIVIGGWLWWRTRAIRREMARTAPATVDGEFREVPPPQIKGGVEDRPR